MENAINLQAVCVTDLVGIAILIVILASRGWILPARKDESRILLIMIVVSVINCFADLLTCVFDGRPGTFNHIELFQACCFRSRREQ